MIKACHPDGSVVAVCRSPSHTFSKQSEERIVLLKGLGVEGDAHMGATVKHRSRAAKDPGAPNLRQVHLIHSELLEELSERGHNIRPGQLGENITTAGLDILGMPAGTQLCFAGGAIVEITGLRDPCSQLDDLSPGLMSAVLDRDTEGRIVRKSGVMGIVIRGGNVSPGDSITVTFPDREWKKLEKV